jgi:hypothetical protein
MAASLKDGVWEVTSKDVPQIGGGLFILISQKDGRVLDIYLTQ